MNIITILDDNTSVEFNSDKLRYRCDSILDSKDREKANLMLKSMKAVVLRYFTKLGFVPCLSGYFELMNTVSIYCLDSSLKDGPLKVLYITVAEIVGRDQKQVKRNLRTYISYILKSPIKDRLWKYINPQDIDLEHEIPLNTFIRMLGDPLIEYINGEDNFCKEFFQ